MSILEIPELPSHYGNRVFVGGNYDDMPTLRKIKAYIKETDFESILAFDFKKVPKKRIYDFDTTLIKLCKYAVFDVSEGNGHMMEIVYAVESLKTLVVTVYKVRSHRHKKPPSALSTMLTTLGVPMLAYDDDDKLREIINMIFPGIKDDPASTWVNIVRAAYAPSWDVDWFASAIDYIIEYV
jgi:hypothetical protein